MNTPVALLIFNRPELTRLVFAKIAEVKPRTLLVIADGPRNEEERARCLEARSIAEVGVTWPCRVLRNYSDANMGCKIRVSSGLGWVFSEVEEAIILEDDCLPDVSFFHYCEELLHRYRSDERIMQISGNNFLGDKLQLQSSYYFSKYAYIWGWATWRRAWKHYDLGIRTWPLFREEGLLKRICPNQVECRHWSVVFDQVFKGQINTWDFSWQYACWVRGGLSVMPTVNLVSNIGAGVDATHTVEGTWYMSLPTAPVKELIHPERIEQNVLADTVMFEDVYRRIEAPLYKKLLRALLSPWTYGAIIRRVPIVGRWWAAWRRNCT